MLLLPFLLEVRQYLKCDKDSLNRESLGSCLTEQLVMHHITHQTPNSPSAGHQSQITGCVCNASLLLLSPSLVCRHPLPLSPSGMFRHPGIVAELDYELLNRDKADSSSAVFLGSGWIGSFKQASKRKSRAGL